MQYLRITITALLALACGPTYYHAGPVYHAAAETEGPEAPPPDDGELTEVAAHHLIIAYYADVGEWAGQYAISQIEATRFEVRGPDSIDVHTRYYYRCLIQYCAGDREGIDQRVFTFERQAGSWQVVRMGDHMSATF